ncbi:MAG: hypothetical protein E7269_07490 [Lachnospiraceae bacterium]|nr:hypothetical protein [Lachnospiraceae bacterium]
MTISAVISMLITFFGYYGLRYGFAIESLPTDLLLYFFSLVLGQYHGVLITKSKRAAEYSQCAIYILIIIAVLFMLFSLSPLALPAFISPVTH